VLEENIKYGHYHVVLVRYCSNFVIANSIGIDQQIPLTS